MTNKQRQKSLEETFSLPNVTPGTCGWCTYCEARIINVQVGDGCFVCCATKDERTLYKLCAKAYNRYVRVMK